MIKLKEILHLVNDHENKGYVNIDDWRWPDVDHLVTMGFKFTDDYHMKTDKDPKMTIYQKEDDAEVNEDNKPQTYFHIEEPNHPVKRFKTFEAVIEFFDNYKQEEIDKNL